MAQPENIAKAVEVGGSALAITCGVCRWMVVNHDFLAVCGIIIGAVCAIGGLAVNVYYQRVRTQFELRQKQRRRS